LKLIASYGIKEVVYIDEYKEDNSSLTLAKEFKINLKKINV
jgi:deoxycytidylate deaminase